MDHRFRDRGGWLLATALVLGVASCAWADTEEPPPLPGWLDRVEGFDAAPLYVDPSFSDDRRNEAIAAARDIAARLDTADQASARLLTQTDRYLAALNGVLGVEPSEAVAAGQRSSFRAVARTGPAMTDRVRSARWVFASGTSIKDHLRAGGKLPGARYDPEKDQVTLTFNFHAQGVLGQRGMVSAGSATLVLPVKPDQPMARLVGVVTQFAQSLGGVGGGLHEAAEMTLIRTIRFERAHRRWFCDGMANAATLATLRRMGRDDEASTFLDDFAIQPYAADLRSRVNLRWWLAKEMETTAADAIKSEDRLESARYVFATHEMNRLAARHGDRVLTKICTRLRGLDHKAGQADLIAVIDTVTGEDFDARLAVYDAYPDRSAALAGYQQAYTDAEDKQDPAAQLTATLQLLELRTGPGYIPAFYTKAASLLNELGHPDAAIATLKRQADTVPDSLAKVRQRYRKLAGRFALKHGKPIAAP